MRRRFRQGVPSAFERTADAIFPDANNAKKGVYVILSEIIEIILDIEMTFWLKTTLVALQKNSKGNFSTNKY
jgi:hypothetical protein